MGARTSYPHGTFSWVDLATTDPEGAKAFYGRLFGWEGDDMPAGEGILADVAPTALALLGIEQPPEMTGRSLLA